MPPSNLPVVFSTTAQDCCDKCTTHDGCVVGVWYSYFCHMLNTTNGVEPLIPTPGYTVVFNGAATTTTTTTTAAPTTTTEAPPTTTTTTSAPPATTTTPAPTHVPPPPALGVVRIVNCDYSSQCSRKEDNTCTTQVFYNDTCISTVTGVRYICGNDTITKAHYANASSCTDFERSTQGISNVCEINQNDEYEGHYCDDYDTFPEAGRSLKRTLCPYGCDDGSECRKAEFTTGVCLPHNPFETILSGNSVIAWCYKDYVVYLGFAGTACEEPFMSSAAEPIGQQCFLDQNEDHIQNLCA